MKIEVRKIGNRGYIVEKTIGMTTTSLDAEDSKNWWYTTDMQLKHCIFARYSTAVESASLYADINKAKLILPKTTKTTISIFKRIKEMLPRIKII